MTHDIDHSADSLKHEWTSTGVIQKNAQLFDTLRKTIKTFIQMKIKRNIIRVPKKGLLILASLPLSQAAFINRIPVVASPKNKEMLPMITDASSFDVLTSVKDSFDVSCAAAYSICSGASSILYVNENVEAEFFGDMSHITLDLATFLSPDTASLRLLLFLGRIFSIVSDYIPDHKINADEVIFQAAMLTYSGQQLIKSVVPLVPLLQRAYVNGDPTIAFRHRRVYLKIFYSAGFSFRQYQLLLTSGALTWISLSPHTNMTLWDGDESDFVYLLHRGPAYHIMVHDDVERYCIDVSEASSAPKINLICDYDSALRLMDGDQSKERIITFGRLSRSNRTSRENIVKQAKPMSLLEAGTKGAMLLKLNIHRVTEMMKDDGEMANCMKRLIFLGLQEKITLTTQN